MRDLFRLIGWAVVDLLRSRAALEAEIWTLRQQINVLRRTAPKRLSFLWRRLHPTASINGYSRSTGVAAFLMAKRIC
jgi:hypothetical protein